MAKTQKQKPITFAFKDETFKINNYRICKTISSKLRGLMFRNKNFKTPLLFVWEKSGKYPIHSFFCRTFMAVWIIEDEKKRKNKIIEAKIVKPWLLSVTPKEKFNRLLEIPLYHS